MMLCTGCATTALGLYGIADTWNMAFIGTLAAGVSALLLNSSDDYFPLLIRPAFGYANFADNLQMLLEHFNYKHVTLLRDNSIEFFSLLVRIIVQTGQTDAPVLYENQAKLTFWSDSLDEKTVDRMLDAARVRCRGKLAHS